MNIGHSGQRGGIASLLEVKRVFLTEHVPAGGFQSVMAIKRVLDPPLKVKHACYVEVCVLNFMQSSSYP